MCIRDSSYTTGFSPIVLENVLQTTIGKKVKGGKIYGGELGIPASRDGKILPVSYTHLDVYKRQAITPGVH